MGTVTPNLGLVKPDMGEQYDIGIFNGNSDKIDSGLALKSHTHTSSSITDFTAGVETLLNASVVIGTYTGNAQANRLISIGFTPRAVIVTEKANGFVQGYYLRGGLVVPNFDLGSTGMALRITSGGFYVHYANNMSVSATNESGDKYAYIAFK